MTPKLYCLDASPPVRSVYLTAAALGLKLERVHVNLVAQEHLTPEFLKLSSPIDCFQMNPQHTVPTLVDDDGTVVWDSHAINTYLISKYGKDDRLYPKDIVKRSKIDQRLHFDSGLAFLAVKNIAEPIAFLGHKSIPDNLRDNAVRVYEFLESFLRESSWMAGENVTVADLCLIPSITSLKYLVPIDPSSFPNLKTWTERIEKLPYYNCNKKGLEDFQKLIDDGLNS
ncbi:hypothetical protein FQA39_LY07305 [Lamprigera yunnana]|nr:hypothetical protein FQA39_LY07305 [Lamprigera yunnana]